MTPIKRAPWLLVLGIVTLVGWAPLGVLLLGSGVASALNCRLDEGSVHPCLVAGVDIGPVLYTATVSGWLILGVWPVMLGTLLIWLGLLIRMIVRMSLRRLRVGGNAG